MRLILKTTFLLFIAATISFGQNTTDNSWAPLDRTTCDITLVEEDNISFQSNALELDFYRNTAYSCGFSGNYTFLVVEPMNNPGAEAPLWVYLHGGGAGYFDENQQYIIGVSPVNGLPHDLNNHNTEKTIEDLRDGQLIHNTHTTNGQIESSTLTRRIMEGYRILIVSMSDHDLHSGMGTPYLNNPNGGEVNGLQANMAAVDYTVANYPTTNVFAHGTSAGSIGAFALAYAYNLEGIKLNGIIMDSNLASHRTETLNESLAGVSGFPFAADFIAKEFSNKVGWIADPDRFPGIEYVIDDGYDIPSLDIYGNLDPGCGGGLPGIDEAHSVGLDNCDWVHDGFRQAVEAQPNSVHKVRVTAGFGHVPTNYASPANDFVDEFISELLVSNPPHPFGQSPVSEDCLTEDCITEETDGYNMLLIGNSFFRPYAEKLDDLAVDAGFENHNSTRITRGGDNGRPINFWNDSNSNEHQQIKATLDQGNVDFFGMTAGHEPEDPIEGHRAWIDYALQNNPDITIFIAIPQIDFPADWEQRAQEFGFETIQELYDFFVNDLVHDTMVDQLRLEFPSTKIFTIPTGQTSLNLDQMNMDNELLDDITRFGPIETSLFTDTKGHQGDIIREAGSLLWLHSIYGVDLSTYDYDTGFDTDLHAIAEDVSNNHDPDYKLCFEESDENEVPAVKCDSTYVVNVEKDVTYAEGLSHDDVSPTTFAIPLKLDVYVPDNNIENRPVYMLIHGGAFSGGSKSQAALVDQAYYFASRGWVVVSIDYRLTGDLGSIFTGIVPQEWLEAANLTTQARQIMAMYTAQRDAKAAMRWIVANADNYNINTDYITVGGGSAGAVTAVTLGISDQDDFRDEISLMDDPTLATTNLDQTYEIQSIVDYWGSNTALEVHEIIYGDHHFDSNDPPLFIAHGTEDPTVLFSEAEELVQLYDSTGVHVEFNPLVGRGHGPWGATLNGKSLSDLSFDFLVEQQGLLLDADCEEETEDTDLCTSDNRFTEIEYFSEAEIDSDLDLIYATDVMDWQGNAQDLAFDIFYPSSVVDPIEKRPFVLMIHGGAFQIGAKENLRSTCQEFAQRGYVAATMQYRLGFNTANPLDQVAAVYRANQDAHAAMRFITENAPMFKIDTDAMFIGGVSAGAITALNVIYIDQQEWNTGFPTTVAQEGPLYSSGNDLTNTYSLKGVFNNWGSNRVASMQTEEMVPSIAFHGAMDNIVPIGEGAFGAYGSGALHDLYLTNGVCSEITVDPQGGHGIYVDQAGTEFRVERASCFFKSIFCDNCTSSYMEEQVFADCSMNAAVDNDGDGFIAEDDCDDNNPAVNPNATEIVYNGIDDDCDPATLDDDLDQDGFNLVDDCDDNNALINSAQAEIVYNGIDDDCDPATLDDDLDQDGFNLVDDCDDTNALINSAQAEIVYNGIDDDCDPATLDDDLDQDGFNIVDDCDDTNANIFPGASDIPDNGIDEDCDGMDATAFVDNDGDGVTNETDCDDNKPDIYPGAPEICNDIDDNCDGQIDEGLLFDTYYADADGDGFGDVATSMDACVSLAGYVLNSEDCDDTNPNIYPGATDIPDNGIDEDCDGMDATAFVDADGDGVTNETDCDDTNPNIYPGAEEICNGIDDNCDGQIDEGLTLISSFEDADGDGFGNPNTLSEDCSIPDGFVANNADCDDTNPNINPDAEEIANNGIDEDCDGMDLVTSTFEISNSTVKIFPNPANHVINIEIDGALDFEATIYDLHGRVIMSLVNEYQFNIALLAEGIYLLEIKDVQSATRVAERILVQR